MQMHKDEKYNDEIMKISTTRNYILSLIYIYKDDVDASNCFLIVNYKVGRALTSMFYLHE